MYIAEALLFFYLVTFKKYSKDELCDLFGVVIFSGLIIATAIVYAWLNGSTGKVSLYSIYGNVVEENYTGSLLAIIFIVGILRLYLTKKNMLLILIQIGIVGYGVMLTGCRAAVLGILISLVVFVLTSTRLSAKTILTLLALGFFISVAGYFLYNLVPAWTWQRIFENSYNDNSNRSRLLLWKQALHGFLIHPIHGWGVGNYSSTFLFNRNSSIVAHNSYLAILVDGGIVYFLLMLSLVFSIIKEIMFKRKPFIALPCCFFVVTFIVEANRMAFFWYGLFLITIIATSPDLHGRHVANRDGREHIMLV
jgi:O-antigen ligase